MGGKKKMRVVNKKEMRSHQEFLRAALLFSSSNTASFAKRPRDSCGFLLPCKSGFRWDFGFLLFFWIFMISQLSFRERRRKQRCSGI